MQRFKPTPWALQPALVDPAFRWAWERSPLVMLPMWYPGGTISTGTVRSLDPSRRVMAQSNTMDWRASSRGHAAAFTSVSNRYLRLPSSGFLSTTAITVVLHQRKLDGTNRISGAFGVSTNVGVERCGVHLPYNDGTVYWDFGGFTEGTTRISAASLTFGDDIWVFTAGPRGMEIWQNGFKRASHATASVRTASSDAWGLGHHGGTGNDTFESAVFMAFGQQFSEAEVRQISIDPFGPFRQARRRVAYFSSPGAPGALADFTAGSPFTLNQSPSTGNTMVITDA